MQVGYHSVRCDSFIHLRSRARPRASWPRSKSVETLSSSSGPETLLLLLFVLSEGVLRLAMPSERDGSALPLALDRLGDLWRPRICANASGARERLLAVDER